MGYFERWDATDVTGGQKGRENAWSGKFLLKMQRRVQLKFRGNLALIPFMRPLSGTFNISNSYVN